MLQNNISHQQLHSLVTGLVMMSLVGSEFWRTLWYKIPWPSRGSQFSWVTVSKDTASRGQIVLLDKHNMYHPVWHAPKSSRCSEHWGNQTQKRCLAQTFSRHYLVICRSQSTVGIVSRRPPAKADCQPKADMIDDNFRFSC